MYQGVGYKVQSQQMQDNINNNLDDRTQKIVYGYINEINRQKLENNDYGYAQIQEIYLMLFYVIFINFLCKIMVNIHGI